jgi:hypothetical protein
MQVSERTLIHAMELSWLSGRVQPLHVPAVYAAHKQIRFLPHGEQEYRIGTIEAGRLLLACIFVCPSSPVLQSYPFHIFLVSK